MLLLQIITNTTIISTVITTTITITTTCVFVSLSITQLEKAVTDHYLGLSAQFTQITNY